MTEKKPLGVLILHGFTGSLDTVKAVVPFAEALGLPYRMPVLRGHGTRYEDLVGVTQRDWFADAERALNDLLGEVERVVIVGLSMGALVALNLAMVHGTKIAELILIAPALRFADPLTPLTPLIKLIFTFWDAPSAFEDKRLEANCTNYKKFPTRTFSFLLDYSCEIERRLGEVRLPVLALFTRKDKTVHPIAAKLLADRLGGPPPRVVWFERSGHEMLQDCEAEAIAQTIGDELAALAKTPVGA